MTVVLVSVYFIIGLIVTAMCPGGEDPRSVEITIDTLLGLFWPVVVAAFICSRVFRIGGGKCSSKP